MVGAVPQPSYGGGRWLGWIRILCPRICGVGAGTPHLANLAELVHRLPDDYPSLASSCLDFWSASTYASELVEVNVIRQELDDLVHVGLALLGYVSALGSQVSANRLEYCTTYALERCSPLPRSLGS